MDQPPAEVKARGIHVKIPQSLLDWMKRETKLGNPALEKEVQQTGDPHLKHALDWSKAMNESIGRIVRAVRRFRWSASASNASAARPTSSSFPPRPTKPCSGNGRSTTWPSTP